MQIISIANQKGGVGKTTTAINLATSLAMANKKTLLIDLDAQGNASSGLGFRRPQIGTYNVLAGETIDSVALPTNNKNLFITCGNQSLAGAEIELVTEPNREFILKNALKSNQNYDAVIIDCPPSLGMLTLNALTASDFVLIPVQAEFYALEGLSLLMETIAKVKHLWNPDIEIIGLALTMYDRRNIFHKQVENEIRKHFKSIMFDSIISRNIRLAEAASFGKSINEYDSFSSGSKAYSSLADELIDRLWKKD